MEERARPLAEQPSPHPPSPIPHPPRSTNVKQACSDFGIASASDTDLWNRSNNRHSLAINRVSFRQIHGRKRRSKVALCFRLEDVAVSAFGLKLLDARTMAKVLGAEEQFGWMAVCEREREREHAREFAENRRESSSSDPRSAA